jgi:hypothetical protein
MGPIRGAEQAPERRRAPAETGGADAPDGMVDTPVEFQPESGALGPREAEDEASRERDPREDI